MLTELIYNFAEEIRKDALQLFVSNHINAIVLRKYRLKVGRQGSTNVKDSLFIGQNQVIYTIRLKRKIAFCFQVQRRQYLPDAILQMMKRILGKVLNV